MAPKLPKAPKAPRPDFNQVAKSVLDQALANVEKNYPPTPKPALDKKPKS